MKNNKMLSQTIAETILSMITVEKRFAAGDKLPNENDLSQELHVSRTTLREAIRLLIAQNILQVERGRGTFVTGAAFQREQDLEQLSGIKVNGKDLFEMRLIFEPEAAYYAAVRGSEGELGNIAQLGKKIEEKISSGENRTADEHAFHRAIAQATHNEFMNKLMPILHQAISKGVALSQATDKVIETTVNDHKMIVEFLLERNGEGARDAMRIHILHAMKELDLK